MTNPWKHATTLADLGNAMADWLGGRGPRWPGYGDNDTDTETRHLLPTLIACNRAGFVTTCSQPGQPPTRGYDGRTWRQRAAVTGWVADSRLLDRIRVAAKGAGVAVLAHRPGTSRHDGVPVTEASGEPYTWFGHTEGHRKQIHYEWPGIGGQAVRNLRTATILTLIDLQWGRDSVLWPALTRAVG